MPMTFTIAAPGAVLPPARKPKASLAPLAWFEKDWTAPGTREIVRALTTDPGGEREWMFERSPDGTWAAGHFPTETVVKAGLRKLAACRAYVASGRAEADLRRIQVHEDGKHETERDKDCPRC